MATTFVLFLLSPAYAALGQELERRGLAFAHPDIPTGVLRPDGSSLVLRRDRAANIAAFDALAAGDGAQYAADMARLGADAPFLFALLGGRLWSWDMAKTVATRSLAARDPRRYRPSSATALGSARHWLQPHYRSDLFHALHGALGAALRGWGPRAPIPGRWRRSSPSRSRRLELPSSRAERRTSSRPSSV